MTPQKPYLIRALYDWILDNQCTPYILVDANHPESQVPTEYVRDGSIVLNLAPEAIQGLSLQNAYIQFSARFGGKSRDLSIPVEAVMAIYAQENNQGMQFLSNHPHPPPTQPAPSKPSKPHLKVIK